MGRIRDIYEQSIDNEYFRQVLATGKHVQVVIMSIPAGEDIGEETHPDNDQVLYLAEGYGEAVLDGKTGHFCPGDIYLVPAGTKHNFINKGDKPLKIITSYSPPHHPDGTIHKTKAEAEAADY